MGQIVKRKKKGRPSKADLARRSASGQIPSAAAQLDQRRSLRRRNVRYNNFIDFDDYLDEEFEEDEDEEEENRRKEKKLKLVLKLNNQTPKRNSRSARENHARENGAPHPSPLPSGSSSEEDESERKPLKKRKINGAGGDDNEADDESENDQRNDDDEEEEEEEEEEGEDNNNNNNNNRNQEVLNCSANRVNCKHLIIERAEAI